MQYLRSFFGGRTGMKFSSDELIPFSEARSGMSKVKEKLAALRRRMVTKQADFATYRNNVADDKTVTESDQAQELKNEQGTK